jgi:flagellin FlaB
MEKQMFRYISQRAARTLRSERGDTGLETAIILIAFVVVASVFAYTVLTAGVFSSQKSSETVNAAIDEVRSNITLNGNTIAYKGDVDIDGVATTTADRVAAVAKIAVTAAVTLSGLPIDVTPAYQLNGTNGSLESSGETNSLVINFVDQRQVINNVAWTVAFSGANDGDFSLEPTERAVITVWLVDYSYDNTAGLYYNLGTDKNDPFLDASGELLGKFNPFSLQFSPVQGTPLVIEKIVPQSLNDIMNLR